MSLQLYLSISRSKYTGDKHSGGLGGVVETGAGTWTACNKTKSGLKRGGGGRESYIYVSISISISIYINLSISRSNYIEDKHSGGLGGVVQTGAGTLNGL